MIDILLSLSFLMYSFVLPYCGLMSSDIASKLVVVIPSQKLTSKNPMGTPGRARMITIISINIKNMKKIMGILLIKNRNSFPDIFLFHLNTRTRIRMYNVHDEEWKKGNSNFWGPEDV